MLKIFCHAFIKTTILSHKRENVTSIITKLKLQPLILMQRQVSEDGWMQRYCNHDI